MHLRLYNFKCYEAEEFTIPDQGLVLISAPSGRGKSTIIEAILFVLFGTGKKLPTWGKKSCKVELEYENLFIIRTKVPNRLVVRVKTCKGDQKEYEDASAQSIIDEKFGEVFQTTSFVDNHNLHKSFILMSPIDKLAFLEKFALKDIDLVTIKNKIKEGTKRAQQDLISAQNRLATAQEILNSMDPPQKIDFPLKKSKSTPESKLIKNEEIRYKNSRILISRAEKSLKALEKDRNEIQLFDLKKAQLSESITELQNSYQTLLKKQNEIEKLSSQEITALEKDLENLIKNRELTSLEKAITELSVRYKESEKKEREELRSSILKLKERITEDPKKLESLLATLYVQKTKAAEHDKIVKELREYEDISREDLESFQEELTKVEEEITKEREILERVKMSQETLHCPKCQAGLKIEYQGTLVNLVETGVDSMVDLENRSPESISENITKLNKNMAYLRKTIIEDTRSLEQKEKLSQKLQVVKDYFHSLTPEVPKEDLKVNLKKTEEEIQKNNNLLNTTNNELDKLQSMECRFRNNQFSSTITGMKNDLTQKREKYEKLKENYVEVEGDEQELSQKLTEQKVLIREYDLLEIQISEIQRKLRDKQSDLASLEEKHAQNLEKDISLIEEEIEKKEQEIVSLKEKFLIYGATLEKVKEYQNYAENKKKYTQLEDKIELLSNEEIEAGKKLQGINSLKQKILESESIAIHSVIDSINDYASGYLSLFFPEEPMSVSLLPFKESKNKKSEKPQINIQIIYKNEECDITSLSGGELSRLVLAFTLALGEMFNTPSLLLDECTASLDQVNTQNVFSAIKQNFASRLVLAIAHQVVEGSYDHVIKL